MVKEAAKIFLINPGKEILLFLRDDNPKISYPGYWDLIGGVVEEGESYLEAIYREIGDTVKL